MFGVVQVVSIFISFMSLFFSVLHFNELEAKSMTVKSAGKVLLGILFFLLTIVFRAVGLALILCFLGWWAAIIIFLMFFSTVLTALCIGDNILRATVYGIWSFLVPVGYTRDPMDPLDYNVLSTKGEKEKNISSVWEYKVQAVLRIIQIIESMKRQFNVTLM